MPSSVRASVVLPLPDSPTRPSVSPGQIAALTAVERVHVVAAVAVNTFVELVELDERRLRRGRSAGSSMSARLLARKRRGALVVPAAARVSGRDGLERRLLGVTALVGESAAVGEHAAGDLRAELRQEAGIVSRRP